MSIKPETLRRLRKERNLSQDALAACCAQINGAQVSKRTIARIESGETPPNRVRAHTIESLAKALEVKPEVLARPIKEVSDDDWKRIGYTPIKVPLPDVAQLNYRLVQHHYGIKFQDLLVAAPWMFTLLAQMSLADRRQRLDAASKAFAEAMSQVPEHLGHSIAAENRFEDVCWDEQTSLARRDIFGDEVIAAASKRLSSHEPFDPSEQNPFVDFLKALARKADSTAIDADHIELPRGGGMPNWPVFENWLEDLTGGNSLARFAIEKCRIGLAKMPEDLKGAENTAARVSWLIDQIPPEIREEEEKRRAEDTVNFEDL